MKLSTNFRLSDFTKSHTADSLGIVNTPDPKHMDNLKFTATKMEVIAGLLGFVPTISSAYRNPELNRAVGGVPNSSHALGLAVDFSCPKFGTVKEVFLELIQSGITFDQLIWEDNGRSQWIHIGFQEPMRQQVLRYKDGVYSLWR